MRATTNCNIRLRSGPGRGAAGSSGILHSGTLVTVEKASGRWLYVTAPGGASGYVPKRSICLEDKEHLELSQVLLGELEAITRARPRPCPQETQQLLEDRQEEQKLERRRLAGYLQPEQRKQEEYASMLPVLHAAKLKALCLSGGGIRSATFNLGVLQGLARVGVLKETDYLSTVSGGGYIGSWLSASVTWQKEADPAASFETVVKALADEEPPAREPYQIRFLRDYSNYLTPRVGVLSVDTWAIVGTYLRNLFLNWLVLLPLFVAVLLMPRIMAHFASGDVIFSLQQEAQLWGDREPLAQLLAVLREICATLPFADPRSTNAAPFAQLFAAAGAVCAAFPIAHTVNNLPSVNNFKQSRLDFMRCFLLPLFCMACLLSAYWGYRYRPGCTAPAFWHLVGFGSAAHLLGFLVAVISPLGKAGCAEQAKKEGLAKKGERLMLAFLC